MTSSAVLQTEVPGWSLRQGKVRDVYDLGDRLLIVATDRISAFDWILPTAIPDKGRVLTQISLYWFGRLGVPHHVLSTDVADFGLPSSVDAALFEGRSMLVRKAEVAPVECVVRGYLAGSGWKEYQRQGTVCGIPLPAGLTESAQLPAPIFTPATKATSGHDENIPFERMAEVVGREAAEELRTLSQGVYQRGAAEALDRGIIIADTKFEWGQVDGRWILVDEVLTPDSSRFWPADRYAAGRGQASFDKQFVRDWLEQTTWDKNSPPPELPPDIVSSTRAKYIEAFERLTSMPFRWK